MARVTGAEVKEIIDTDLSEAEMTPFITAANLLVTNVVSVASVTPSIGNDELKEIERWLAAHLVCMRDPRGIRQKIGDAEVWTAPNVTTAWGKQLDFTWYGQQVRLLDRSGQLAKLGLARASFRVSPRENSTRFTDNLS